MKSKPVKRNAPTHYEQIPLAVVKKIALEKERKKKTTEARTVIAEPPARKTEPYSVPLSSLCWTGH
jgi:hypothetical protein